MSAPEESAKVAPLTGPQANALRALADLTETMTRDIRPRDVAMALWPDSEGWDKRSSRRSNRVKQGALGATMPMKAATLLGRLQERGCAMSDYDGNWTITDRGLGVLDGTRQPLPKPEKPKPQPVTRRKKPPRLQPGGADA